MRNLMKRASFALAILVCVSMLASASASDALVDMLTCDEVEAGVTLEAMRREDGLLLIVASEDTDEVWLDFRDRNGERRRMLADADFKTLRCLSPLADGGLAVLRKTYEPIDRHPDRFDPDVSALLAFDRNGKTTSEVPLWSNVEWLLAGAGGYYAIGFCVTGRDDETIDTLPRLARLDGNGETLWDNEYSNPDYTRAMFVKGAMAEDSIILCGEGYSAVREAHVGLLDRVGMDGNVIWSLEITPDIGKRAFVNDICVTSDGLIAAVCTSIAYDEDFGFPVDRSCTVYCLSVDGEVLWQHALQDAAMLNYVMPVAGGFLCASRGMDLDNCPYLGEGWLLLLDWDGKVKAAGGTPDIGGGKFELTGMSLDTDGIALLYGTVLEEPGFPGAPFIVRLNFPEAYE